MEKLRLGVKLGHNALETVPSMRISRTKPNSHGQDLQLQVTENPIQTGLVSKGNL